MITTHPFQSLKTKAQTSLMAGAGKTKMGTFLGSRMIFMSLFYFKTGRAPYYANEIITVNLIGKH